MDNMFQLRQDMTQEEQLRFEQDRLQEEQTVEEYLGKTQMNSEKLKEQLEGRAAVPVPEQPIVADMPQQQVDEKESKRRRREKAQFKEQSKILEKNRKKEREDRQDFAQRAAVMQQQRRIDKKAMAIFEETIRADMLSPRYVLEHFAEVREKLDAWRDHIRLFEQGGAAAFLTTREQTLRIPLMKNMYVQAEQAFRTALGALGYSYNEQAAGEDMLLENLTPEQKQQALEQNMAQRTRIARDAISMDDAVAQELLTEEAPITGAVMATFREDMLHNEKYSFIESQNLSHEYQYDELEKAKTLLESHPQEYEQNKELLDQLYHELFNLMELNGKYYEASQSIMKIQFDKQKVSSHAVQAKLQKKLDEQENKMRLSRNRAACIQSGIRHVLLGKALTQSEIRVLKDYLPEEFEEAGRTAEIEAGDYADRYREKKAIFESLAEHLYGEQAQELISGVAGRYMMFIEPGQEMHNEAVLRSLEISKNCERRIAAGGEDADAAKKALGRAVKPMVLPYLTRMRDFDTKELENCTDEELMERNEELQDLYISGMQAVDAAKYVDPDDPQGRSIKEVFYGEKKELFALKCSVVQSYAVKARALCMIRAYTQTTLSEACYTEAELRRIRGTFGVAEGTALSAAQLLSYAKGMLERETASQDAAYNRYFKSESVQQSYIGHKNTKEKNTKEKDTKEKDPHPIFMGRVDIASRNARTALGLEKGYVLEVSDMKAYYEMCQKRAEEIERELPGAAEEAASELETELADLKRDMEAMNVTSALHRSNYKRSGDAESPLREALFRSYTSINGLPAFRNMSEEDFRRMCVQLSAGRLEADNQEPARLEAYYAENMQGLLTYKQHMSEHYEMLEARFHHRLPSAEYIMEHSEELNRLFANIQVDTGIVENFRDMLDLTKPEDLRLFHLVQWYNALGGYVTGIGISASLAMPKYQDAVEISKAPMEKAKDSLAYLSQPQEQIKEGPQTEAEAEKTATIEKFRQLGADTAHILTADDQRKAEYLQRVNELKEYIQQHRDDRTLTMRQFKGWYEMAQKKFPYLAKDMFHHFSQGGAQPAGEDAFPVIAQKLSALQLTEEMLTDEYITLHIEELLSSFKAMDDYRRLVEGNPGLAETIPAGQQLAWEKNKGIYEKYRDYVTEFARSHQVDIAKGTYLTEEAYQAEKEETAQTLQKEKESMQTLLGGFGNYSQKTADMVKRINSMRGLSDQDKAKILKPLQEAGEWLKDLTRYLTKPLELSAEDFFDATIMTLMSMFGYIEKNLYDAENALTGAEGAEDAEELVSQMRQIAGTFTEFKERVPGQAQDLRRQILASGAEQLPTLTLRDIVLASQEIKTFHLSGQQEDVGAGTSDVIKIREGNKEFFFKEDLRLPELFEAIREVWPLLENEELSQRFSGFFERNRQAEDREGATQKIEGLGRIITSLLNAMREHPEATPQMLEAYLSEINSEIGRDYDLIGYATESPEKWKKFLQAFSRCFETYLASKDSSMLLDVGADMTARNYASERVAELLGLKGLIIRNREAVIINENGEKKKGFIMDMAEGAPAQMVLDLAEEHNYKVEFSAEAQKKLLNLLILDSINGQIDRHMNNCFMEYEISDDGKRLLVKNVTGIDNDFAFGKSKRIGSEKTGYILKRENALQRDSKLKYYLGMIDKQMYESLLAVSPELLEVNLKNVIEPDYLEALKKRYEIVRGAIIQAKEESEINGGDFFREKGGWGAESQQLLKEKRPSSTIDMLF